MNETEAAEKARGKADLDAKEAANKAEFLPLHTAHTLRYKDISYHIKHALLVHEMKNSTRFHSSKSSCIILMG